jgi:hypothetical protein
MLGLDLGANRVVGIGERRVDLLTEDGDTPRPQRHAEEVREDAGGLAHAQPEAAVEHADHRRQARAEHPLGQVRGRHEGGAVGTAHPIPAMLDDLGRDRRDLPDLDPDRLALGRQRRVQRERATGTLGRAMRDLSGDLVGGELDAGVARMARLPAPFPARRLAPRMRPRAGRVARRRARGVRRFLVDLRLEVGQLPLQLGHRRLQGGHLIAQERALVL